VTGAVNICNIRDVGPPVSLFERGKEPGRPFSWRRWVDIAILAGLALVGYGYWQTYLAR